VSVDVLRALAALAVVVGHIPFTGGDLPPPLRSLLGAALHLGRLGVPLFLVLSGFCIHLGVARGIAGGEGVCSDWGRFWARRFWRLYPPYLAAIAVSLALYVVAGAEAFLPIERVVSLPWDLLTHLLLVHNLFADYCFSLGNGPFWTLGLEEQLYALYALFLCLRRRRTVGRVVCLILLVSLTWQCAWHLCLGTDDGAVRPVLGPSPVALGRWLKWPVGLWFAWVLGAVAAEAYAGAVRLPGWCTRRRTAVLLAVVGLATSHAALDALSVHGLRAWEHFSAWPRSEHLRPLLRLLSGFSDLAFSGAAFVVLNRWVRQEVAGHFRGWLACALGRVGVMSYSLYLVHMPLVRLLVSWMPPGTSLAAWVLRLAVILPACLGFAALFFVLVERRFLTVPGDAPAAKAGSPRLRGGRFSGRVAQAVQGIR
jgi:peptidoglycan/LPS O-acetylase OafA/YrhL